MKLESYLNLYKSTDVPRERQIIFKAIIEDENVKALLKAADARARDLVCDKFIKHLTQVRVNFT